MVETQIPHAPTYSEWIEIKNLSSSAASLDGYALSDDEGVTDKWVFPSGLSIEGGGFLVVLADGLDGEGDYVHTSFSLASKGEFLGLFDSSGVVVDAWSTSYPRQFPSHSYGREPGGTSLVYLEDETPGAENTGPQSVDFVRKPTFSVPAGFHESPVSVVIETITAGASIHYTLDGNEPTTSSPVYSTPIPSTAGVNLVIRARAFHPSLVPSLVTSSSYFMNQPEVLKTLPVISWAGGEGEVFYDPDGVIDGTRDQGRERERMASMEFFQNDNSDYEQINVGLRLASGAVSPVLFPPEGLWSYLYIRPQFNVFFRGE